MKIFKYHMPAKMIFLVIIFFSIGPILMFNMRKDICGNVECALKTTLNIYKYPLEILDLGGITFIIIGLWRYIVRFMSTNNRVVLESTYCIFPGLLQMLPEKKINYADIDHVERVTLKANQLFKLYFKNKTYPYTFSINNSMASEDVEDLWINLNKKITQSN